VVKKRKETGDGVEKNKEGVRPVTSYKLHVTSYGLRVTSYNVQVAGYELHVANEKAESIMCLGCVNP